MWITYGMFSSWVSLHQFRYKYIIQRHSAIFVDPLIIREQVDEMYVEYLNYVLFVEGRSLCIL